MNRRNIIGDVKASAIEMAFDRASGAIVDGGFARGFRAGRALILRGT
jgi:hypothetical protein